MTRRPLFVKPLGTILLVVLALLSGQAVTAAAEPKDAKKPAAKAAKQDSKKAAPGEAKQGLKKPSAEKKAGGDSDQAAKTPAKPASYRVKKGPFRIEVALDGFFQAEKTAEIVVRPREWSGLTVLKAAEHGSPVKQGDLLLALDPEKIDHGISDLRADLQIGDLSLKQAAEQLRALEKSAPLDLEAADRAGRMAAEDWKQYQEVDKPMGAKIVDFNLKMAQQALEYQEEEYRQLKKMYRADDLTEETEKIVLQRTLDQVNRAKFNLEYANALHDEAKKFVLPRRDERVREATRRTEIDAARAKIMFPLTMSKQQLEFEKLKVQQKQGEERLGKLLADRAAMTVKAPMDGIVYYGRFSRGKWISGASSDPFRRGAAVMANDVVMTVVQARPLVIRSSVPETQVQYLHTGLRGIAVPGGFPDLKLGAVVQSVSAVPVSGTNFEAQFIPPADGLPDAIVPGMTCEVRLIPYKKTGALCVPPKAVFTEALDPLVQYVYLSGRDGKPHKRPVTPGRRNDKQVEILKGLSEGDQILLEEPKE
jgi:multidrug resistance efflux pump